MKRSKPLRNFHVDTDVACHVSKVHAMGLAKGDSELQVRPMKRTYTIMAPTRQKILIPAFRKMNG